MFVGLHMLLTHAWVLCAFTGAYEAGIKKALMAGVGMAVTMGLVLLIYALSFWYAECQCIHSVWLLLIVLFAASLISYS